MGRKGIQYSVKPDTDQGLYEFVSPKVGPEWINALESAAEGVVWRPFIYRPFELSTSLTQLLLRVKLV